MTCEKVQVILELVFGFREDHLTPEFVDHCTKTFTVWEAHLFSYPINLPGFGAVLLNSLRREAQAFNVMHLFMRTSTCEFKW